MTIWYEHYRCQKISTIGQHQCTKPHGHKSFCTAKHGMLNLKFGLGPTWEDGVSTRTTNKEKVYVTAEFLLNVAGVDISKIRNYSDEEQRNKFVSELNVVHYIHPG